MTIWWLAILAIAAVTVITLLAASVASMALGIDPHEWFGDDDD